MSSLVVSAAPYGKTEEDEYEQYIPDTDDSFVFSLIIFVFSFF